MNQCKKKIVNQTFSMCCVRAGVLGMEFMTGDWSMQSRRLFRCSAYGAIGAIYTIDL